MKKLVFIVLFYFVSYQSFCQKILSKVDSLSSTSQVEKLIQSIDKNYKKFILKSIKNFNSNHTSDYFCKKIADSLNLNESFYKADFDNNGFTDLLVIGTFNENDFNIISLFNYGKNSFKLKTIIRSLVDDCSFPKVINDTILKYHFLSTPAWNKEYRKPYLESSDLIYKHGSFVEHNTKNSQYNIEKIEYETTHCYGSCPVFSLEINKNKSSIFNAISYNRKSKQKELIKGTFKTILIDSYYSEITELLNYIDFSNLKDQYSVGHTCAQTCYITITYNNGQVKKIKDYGLSGTFGLRKLHNLMYDLRFNQDWKKD